MNTIDLHMHSDYSNDGEYSPEELARRCHDAGLRVMAVSDHNCCRACEEAIRAADAYGITCLPAIELDCMFCGENLHILGYGIDCTDQRYAQLEEELAGQERATSAPRIRKMRELGLHIDEDKAYSLAHYGFVTGEVIAEVALGDPENDDHPMLRPYRPGGSRSDNPYVNFYWDWCGPGKTAYFPFRFISLAQAVDLIVSTGGIPVLAHPGNTVRDNEKLLHDILAEGVQGIEAYSGYHSAEQTAYYRAQALRYGVPITCGSDYHGKTKPAILLGSIDLGDDEKRILESLREWGLIH